MVDSGLLVLTREGGLAAIPFRGAVLYSESPEIPLRDDDLLLLRSRFEEHLAIVEPYLREHHSHVFVPLSAPEEGHHASFSGQLDLEALVPFFRRRPNAMTVVDGRPWGYFRIRLQHVANDLSVERIAEIEVHTAEPASDVGFELYWGLPLREPTHIRVYDREPHKGTGALEGLMSQWATRLKLMRSIEGLFATV